MRYLGFLISGWSILLMMHWLTYSSVSSALAISVPYSLFWLGLLAASYFIAALLVRKKTNRFSNMLYVGASVWLGVIVLVFSFQLPHILYQIATGESLPLLSGGLLLLSLVVSAYAVFNASRLVTKEYTLPIAGLAQALTIAHLTDIHIGTVHQANYLQTVVDKTNALQPDIVCITGDLFDGSVPIDESILSSLNALSAPTFYSNGNHEEYEGLQHVRDTLGHVKGDLLENSFVLISGLQVVGVNDKQSLPKGQTLGTILDTLQLHPELPTVLMYHTPVEWEEARARKVDLMLSGHTHNGQIYPFTLLVRMAYKYITGLYQVSGLFLHVSPGTGTWGPPMRLGSRNQITLLRLVTKTS